MRLRITAVLVAVLAAVLGTLLTGTRAAGAATGHTTVTTVRPVTSHGHAALGYQVKDERGGSIYCSYPNSSPAAVSRNIEFCDPSAEVAIACWKAVTPHRALCLRDGRSHSLASIALMGGFAATKPWPVRIPLTMRLTDGTTCTLRAGGTGPGIAWRPNWAVWYWCDHGLDVWGPMSRSASTMNHGVVNTAHPVWTVQVGHDANNTQLWTAKIAQAWFVGTRY